MTDRVLIEEWWELEDNEGCRHSRPIPEEGNLWWSKHSRLHQHFTREQMAPGSGGSHGGTCVDTVKLQYPERAPFKTFHVRRFRARRSGDVTIVQPVGNCDGSRRFAFDATKENGRGEPLVTFCPGCRACS